MWVNQHITQSSEWAWWVRWAGNNKFTKKFNTQEEAISHWRQIAMNQWSELLIHWRDWKIRERNSYWNDPFPPKW